MSSGKRMASAWYTWRERLQARMRKNSKDLRKWTPRGKMSKRARHMLRAGMRDEIRSKRVEANHGAVDYPTRWDKRRRQRMRRERSKRTGEPMMARSMR